MFPITGQGSISSFQERNLENEVQQAIQDHYQNPFSNTKKSLKDEADRIAGLIAKITPYQKLVTTYGIHLEMVQNRTQEALKSIKLVSLENKIREILETFEICDKTEGLKDESLLEYFAANLSKLIEKVISHERLKATYGLRLEIISEKVNKSLGLGNNSQEPLDTLSFNDQNSLKNEEKIQNLPSQGMMKVFSSDQSETATWIDRNFQDRNFTAVSSLPARNESRPTSEMLEDLGNTISFAQRQQIQKFHETQDFIDDLEKFVRTSDQVGEDLFTQAIELEDRIASVQDKPEFQRFLVCLHNLVQDLTLRGSLFSRAGWNWEKTEALVVGAEEIICSLNSSSQTKEACDFYEKNIDPYQKAFDELLLDKTESESSSEADVIPLKDEIAAAFNEYERHAGEFGIKLLEQAATLQNLVEKLESYPEFNEDRERLANLVGEICQRATAPMLQLSTADFDKDLSEWQSKINAAQQVYDDMRANCDLAKDQSVARELLSHLNCLGVQALIHPNPAIKDIYAPLVKKMMENIIGKVNQSTHAFFFTNVLNESNLHLFIPEIKKLLKDFNTSYQEREYGIDLFDIACTLFEVYDKITPGPLLGNYRELLADLGIDLTKRAHLESKAAASTWDWKSTQKLIENCAEIEALLNALEMHMADVDKQSPLLATGFQREGSNCWINSLLHMILSVPAYEEVYRQIAQAAISKNDENSCHGKALLQALDDYYDCLAKKQSVPASVSQSVRVAFHYLIGDFISVNSWVQGDPYEGLMAMLAKINEEKGYTLPPQLYTPLIRKKHFKLSDNTLGIIEEKITEEKQHECHLLLDLQENEECTFYKLLNNYFDNPHALTSDAAHYEGKSFQPVSETCQFTHVPDQFSLVLKRVGMDKQTGPYKITTPVHIPRVLILPEKATTANKPIAYKLVCSIPHQGDFKSGHYITYKHVEDKWIELNDGSSTIASDEMFDRIHSGEHEDGFIPYLLHYVKISEEDLNVMVEVHKASINEEKPMIETKKRTYSELEPIEAEASSKRTRHTYAGES